MADTDTLAQAHIAAAETQLASGNAASSVGSKAPEDGASGDETPVTESGGLFGWSLPDINVVKGSLGGIFGESSMPRDGADDETRERDDSGANGQHRGNNIGKVAADMAADASKELEHASKAAQETIGKAAEEIGKGWGSLNTFLDDMLAANSDKEKATNDDDIRDDDDVQARYHALFPEVDADDDVVDHYSCSLLQKYRCYLNNATPERTFSMRGRLFVSTSNIAMHVFDAQEEFEHSKFNIIVPFSDIARVQKGAKSMMRVITKSQTSYIFSSFESDTHFNASLSLVEHMIESNPQVIDVPKADEHAQDPTGGENGNDK
jgi:hypothetical protein